MPRTRQFARRTRKIRGRTPGRRGVDFNLTRRRSRGSRVVLEIALESTIVDRQIIQKQVGSSWTASSFDNVRIREFVRFGDDNHYARPP